MGKINWGLVFLCGLVTGVLWGLLWPLIFTNVVPDFPAAVRAATIHPFPPPGANLYIPIRVAFFVLMNLAQGMLYENGLNGQNAACTANKASRCAHAS